jgi:hypothetical protein
MFGACGFVLGLLVCVELVLGAGALPADVVNEYDGLAPQQRMSVQFSGPVNVDTLRDGLFYVTVGEPPVGEFGLWPAGEGVPFFPPVHPNAARSSAVGSPDAAPRSLPCPS